MKKHITLLGTLLVVYSGIYAQNTKVVPITLGASFFAGTNFLNGNMGRSYTQPISFGVSIDVCYNRILFRFEDRVGLSQTRKVLDYDAFMKKDKGIAILQGLASLDVGYVIANSRNLMIAPYSGVSLQKLAPDVSGLYRLNDKYMPGMYYWDMGCIIHLKRWNLLKQTEKNSGYLSPALTISYQLQMSTPNFPNYNQGNLLNVTLGLGSTY